MATKPKAQPTKAKAAAAKSTDGVSKLAASVGLTDADLVGMYRVIATARAVDERMWILNRAGRIPFVISGQGHEGAQAAIAWPLEKKKDWIAPFYRSIATCLTFGMRAQDILTAQYAKAIDLSSGGRQMPGHYGNVANNLVSLSSPVATQMLHAVGHRARGEDPEDRPGRDDVDGRGELEPGRRPRGPELRGDPQAAVHLRASRTTATRSACPAERQLAVPDVAARASGYGIPGVIVDGADVLACYAAAQGGGRPGAARRRPDAHRGQGHPAHRPLVRRPADEVPLRGGARGPAGERPAAALPSAAQDAGVLTDEIEARIAAEVKAEIDEATDYAENAAGARRRTPR